MATTVKSGGGAVLDREGLAKRIDHTLLKAFATRSDVDRLCDEALQFGLGAVCVSPYHVPRARERLGDSGVKVCAVVGFPLGSTTGRAKLAEAKEAMDQGADEIDMVIDRGAFLSGAYRDVFDSIVAVTWA